MARRLADDWLRAARNGRIQERGCQSDGFHDLCFDGQRLGVLSQYEEQKAHDGNSRLHLSTESGNGVRALEHSNGDRTSVVGLSQVIDCQ